MRISVFGLGYDGCVSTGCLAMKGHSVIGVDISEFKVNLINSGKPTIIERDIDAIIRKGREASKIHATVDYVNAVLESEIALICVGTPNLSTGQLNLEYVFNTASQIGEALRIKDKFFVIAIRSTVIPGTNEKFGGIIEEISGKKRNKDFAVVSNPEFLREGSAVEDYYNPALTVLGSDSEKALDILEDVYREFKAPVVRTDIRVAELIKYINNAFHALKISFANEVGNICKKLDIDSFKIMDLFKMDTRLNISGTYFNPGMAYGGSCLPKDLKGLSTISHDHYLNTPVISAIEESNKVQKEKMLALVEKTGNKKVGFYGLAFKKGTDDLRLSPAVDMAEILLGKGYDLKIYDQWVNLSHLTGTNKNYIEQHLPHIAALLEPDLKALVHHADTLVIVHHPDDVDQKILTTNKIQIVDLVRINGWCDLRNYEGICW